LLNFLKPKICLIYTRNKKPKESPLEKKNLKYCYKQNVFKSYGGGMKKKKKKKNKKKKKKKSRVEGRFQNCFPTIEGYPQGVR